MSFFSLQGAHNEHSILNRLRHQSHPNIIRSLDYFEDSRNIVIVLEHMVSDFQTVLVNLT